MAIIPACAPTRGDKAPELAARRDNPSRHVGADANTRTHDQEGIEPGRRAEWCAGAAAGASSAAATGEPAGSAAGGRHVRRRKACRRPRRGSRGGEVSGGGTRRVGFCEKNVRIFGHAQEIAQRLPKNGPMCCPRQQTACCPKKQVRRKIASDLLKCVAGALGFEPRLAAPKRRHRGRGSPPPSPLPEKRRSSCGGCPYSFVKGPGRKFSTTGPAMGSSQGTRSRMIA